MLTEENKKASVEDDFPNRYVAIDLETTGFSAKKSEIIEIGAARVENGIIQATFQTFVKPDNRIPELITQITQITDEMVADAPKISEALLRFINFIDFDLIVAHNASFESGWLIPLFFEHLKIKIENPFIDSLKLTRLTFPEIESHSLEAMTELLSIPCSCHHRALHDVIQTVHVFEFIRAYRSLQNRLSMPKNTLPKPKKKAKPKFNVTASTIAKSTEIDVDIDQANPFFGKTYVITGELPTMSRAEVYRAILSYGGFVSDNITRKTNCLIIGEIIVSVNNPDGISTKQRKAEEYKEKGIDIEIISGEDFEDLLFEAGSEGKIEK